MAARSLSIKNNLLRVENPRGGEHPLPGPNTGTLLEVLSPRTKQQRDDQRLHVHNDIAQIILTLLSVLASKSDDALVIVSQPLLPQLKDPRSHVGHLIQPDTQDVMLIDQSGSNGNTSAHMTMYHLQRVPGPGSNGLKYTATAFDTGSLPKDKASSRAVTLSQVIWSNSGINKDVVDFRIVRDSEILGGSTRGSSSHCMASSAVCLFLEANEVGNLDIGRLDCPELDVRGRAVWIAMELLRDMKSTFTTDSVELDGILTLDSKSFKQWFDTMVTAATTASQLVDALMSLVVKERRHITNTLPDKDKHMSKSDDELSSSIEEIVTSSTTCPESLVQIIKVMLQACVLRDSHPNPTRLHEELLHLLASIPVEQLSTNMDDLQNKIVDNFKGALEGLLQLSLGGRGGGGGDIENNWGGGSGVMPPPQTIMNTLPSIYDSPHAKPTAKQVKEVSEYQNWGHLTEEERYLLVYYSLCQTELANEFAIQSSEREHLQLILRKHYEYSHGKNYSMMPQNMVMTDEDRDLRRRFIAKELEPVSKQDIQEAHELLHKYPPLQGKMPKLNQKNGGVGHGNGGGNNGGGNNGGGGGGGGNGGGSADGNGGVGSGVDGVRDGSGGGVADGGGGGGNNGGQSNGGDGGDGGGGGDGVSKGYFQTSIRSSIIPLLSFHRNLEGSSMDEFPDVQNGPVNMRPKIQSAKFNCIGSRNLWWDFLTGREQVDSPFNTSVLSAAASFVYEDTSNQSADSVYLNSAVSGQEYDEKIIPIELTTDIIRHGLSWLDPTNGQAASSGDVDVSTYLDALRSSVPINGTEEELHKFIKDHTWDRYGSIMWGGNAETFLQRLEHLPSNERKRKKRRYIQENLALQTGVIFLWIDGIHRVVTIDGATVGIPPPGTDSKLQEATVKFANKLDQTPHGALAIRDDNGELVEIDSLTSLGVFHSCKLNRPTCRHFMILSAHKQHGQDQGEAHTSRQVMLLVIRRMHEDMGARFKPGFLLGDDPSSGLPYLWSLGISQEVSKQVLIKYLQTALEKQGFRDQCITSHIDRHHGKIKNSKKLPELYHRLWITEYVTYFRETLRAMLDEDPKLKDIAPELQLDTLLDLSEEQFSSMFKYQDSRNDHLKDDFYALLPGSAKDYNFAASASKSSSLSQNPYRPHRYGRKINNYLYILGESIEFAWLVMWSFLSRSTHKTIEEFLSVPAPDTSIFPQKSVGDKKLTSRYFTCLVQAITTSTKASEKLWKKAYFGYKASGRAIDRATSQLGTFDITLLLLMSSIDDACDCLTKIGVDPAPQDWFLQRVAGPVIDEDEEPQNQPTQLNDGTRFGNLHQLSHSPPWYLGQEMAKDLLVFLTASFMAHVKQDFDRGANITEEEAKFRIDASLQKSFPQLTINHSPEGTARFFGDTTIGGARTLDVRKEDTSGIQFPNYVEAVSGVTGPDSIYPSCTYRISEFVPTTRATFDKDSQIWSIPTSDFFPRWEILEEAPRPPALANTATAQINQDALGGAPAGDNCDVAAARQEDYLNHGDDNDYGGDGGGGIDDDEDGGGGGGDVQHLGSDENRADNENRAGNDIEGASEPNQAFAQNDRQGQGNNNNAPIDVVVPRRQRSSAPVPPKWLKEYRNYCGDRLVSLKNQFSEINHPVQENADESTDCDEHHARQWFDSLNENARGQCIVTIFQMVKKRALTPRELSNFENHKEKEDRHNQGIIETRTEAGNEDATCDGDSNGSKSASSSSSSSSASSSSSSSSSSSPSPPPSVGESANNQAGSQSAETPIAPQGRGKVFKGGSTPIGMLLLPRKGAGTSSSEGGSSTQSRKRSSSQSSSSSSSPDIPKKKLKRKKCPFVDEAADHSSTSEDEEAESSEGTNSFIDRNESIPPNVNLYRQVNNQELHGEGTPTHAVAQIMNRRSRKGKRKQSPSGADGPAAEGHNDSDHAANPNESTEAVNGEQAAGDTQKEQATGEQPPGEQPPGEQAPGEQAPGDTQKEQDAGEQQQDAGEQDAGEQATGDNNSLFDSSLDLEFVDPNIPMDQLMDQLAEEMLNEGI